MSDTTQDLVLGPRDGLFVKDGRGWYTAGAGRAYGLDWPPPSTILGALRTAYGRTQETDVALTVDQWEQLAAQVSLDVALAVRKPLGEVAKPEHRMWPAPADAVYLEGHRKVTRLRPVEPTVETLGSEPDDPARERLWRPILSDQSKPEPAPKWWIEKHFVTWLCGGDVPQLAQREDWPDPQRRLEVHVSIDPGKLTAVEGRLFSYDVVETVERPKERSAWEWALACQIRAPAEGDLTGQVVTLGGKRRLTNCEAAPAALFDPPQPLVDAFADGVRGLRLVVVTPAQFTGGWVPDGLTVAGDQYRGSLGLAGFPEVLLRAAFVGRPLHVSGWDMAARAPKQTRRLVPRGSVYFVQRADGQGFTEEQARSLWLVGLGQSTSEGFGRIVPGVWTPGEE